MKTIFRILLLVVIAGLSMTFAPNETIDLLQAMMSYVTAMVKNGGNYIANLVNGVAPLVK
jgi:hypothetical protein